MSLVAKKFDFEYRANLEAGSMYPLWEMNGPLGCPVPDPRPDGAAPSAVISPECTIGGMAAYVVNATKQEHVSAAVSFAAKYNLRLRIKSVSAPIMMPMVHLNADQFLSLEWTRLRRSFERTWEPSHMDSAYERHKHFGQLPPLPFINQPGGGFIGSGSNGRRAVCL